MWFLPTTQSLSRMQVKLHLHQPCGLSMIAYNQTASSPNNSSTLVNNSYDEDKAAEASDAAETELETNNKQQGKDSSYVHIAILHV